MLCSAAGQISHAAQKSKDDRQHRARELAMEVALQVKSSDCPEPAFKLFDKWKISREWVRGPSDMDGGKLYKTPTAEIGTWVELVVYPKGPVEMYRLAPDSTIQATWKTMGQSACVPQLRVEKREPTGAGTAEITDADLRELSANHRSVLIYMWSPQMPLSVQGLPVAKDVARKFGLDFLPVLDPNSTPEAARAGSDGAHLPVSSLRTAASIELGERGMHLHFPSTLVFAHGRFSPLYPGLWEKVAYLERFIEENLR